MNELALKKEKAIQKILAERNQLFKEKYLSEIIEEEKPVWGSNNLILAPVGSGKTTLIENYLIAGEKGNYLFLVSNTSLKDYISPSRNEVREAKAKIGKFKRTYTTQNGAIYGEGEYKVHVMTYAEFGSRIFLDNDFVSDIDKIFCDEIHSLPNFQSYGNSPQLAAAMKYLFMKQKQQIFYFTATDEYLLKMKKKYPDVLNNVKRFDYINHPQIRKFITLSEYRINHISQIRPHLKARVKSFTQRNIKGLAFSRLISSQEEIAAIAKEEGLTPLVIWSINNKEKEMTDHQKEMRDLVIETGLIPEPYNLLVINSSMQEGWDLDDEAVKLAIINSTNETEKIQSLGRIRQDIDVLIYRTHEEIEQESIVIPEEFLNVYLTPEDKDRLCEALDLRDSKGRLRKWASASKTLEEEGFEIENKQVSINKKRVRVSLIKK